MGIALVLAAQIAGLLVDPADRPVPNAAVTLRSNTQQFQTQTGATGEFQFPVVPPGAYRLQVSVPGFDPIDRGVRIGARAVPSLTLKLSLSSLREQVTVYGQPVRVNVEAAGNADAVSVERSLLDNVPILDLDYLAALARFLDPSTASAGGPSLVVDGMEARNAGVTVSAIQEIRINQNPYTVEYPRWSRRRIEIITKSAADRYHGTFNFVLRDHHLNAREALAVTRPPEQRRIWEGSLFGPVGRSHNTSFLLSGLREHDDLQAVVFAQGLAGPITANVPAPVRNTQASLRISRQFSDRQSAFWHINYQDRFQNNQGAGGTVLAEAATHARFREDEFVFNHRVVLTPRLLSQFRILLGRYWAPIRSNSPLPRIAVSDAFTGGGAQADRLTTEIHTSITWLLTQTRGPHALKYGFNLPDWSRRGLRDQTFLGGAFSYASLEDLRANRPFAAVFQRGDPKVIFVEKNVGTFFQDEWQVRSNLSLALGFRYDWQNYFGDTNNVAPRLALAYAPTRKRDTVFRAGAGFFYERSGPAPIGDLLRYNGVHLRRYVFTGAPATFDAAPTSIVRFEPGIELPDIFMFNVGLERQLSKRTTLAVNYVGNRGFQQLRSRDANAPLPPDFAARPDPRWSVLRRIESAGRLEGNSLEITLRGDIAPRLNGLLQYVYGRTLTNTGGVNWFPADSFDPRGEWGRADTDRRHQFNLLATARLHRWMQLGVSASLLSGPPFNITTGRDDNRDSLANDRPLGVTRNTGRGPGLASLDLRWSHEFRKKDKGRAITASVDAFNVLNRVNYQNYIGALSSPFFGRAVATQPARRVQLGLRVQF